MIEKLIICITAEDIEGASRYELSNPVIHALIRTTGTLWLMSDCGTLIELIEPHRAFVLPRDVLEHCRTYAATKTMPPCEFVAEVMPLAEEKKHLLQQRPPKNEAQNSDATEDTDPASADENLLPPAA